MNSHYCSMLPKFNNLMTDHLFYKELVNTDCLTSDDCNEFDDSLYDLNELEEVFSDHLLMGQRLQRSLYRGNTEDMDDDTDHPPIALTDLALKLFSDAVPNYGLDQLDMDYVSSVSKSTRVSPCAMILALIYLKRLRLNNNDYLESVSPSGLFVVTMLVASKYLFEDDDDVVTNQIWSEELNMDVKELNELEQKFLAAINWRLYVDSSEYFQYLSDVEKMIALKECSIRGWFSYNDIYTILQDAVIKKAILSCIERIMKVSAVSALSYAVTVLSIYSASSAVYCRYNRDQSYLNRSIVMKDKDIGLEQDSKLVTDELFDIKSTVNTVNSDFSYILLNRNQGNLSHSFESSNSLFSSTNVEFKHNSNTYYNSFQNNAHNYTIDKLVWMPTDFKKKKCFPISVK